MIEKESAMLCLNWIHADISYTGVMFSKALKTLKAEKQFAVPPQPQSIENRLACVD